MSFCGIIEKDFETGNYFYFMKFQKKIKLNFKQDFNDYNRLIF